MSRVGSYLVTTGQDTDTLKPLFVTSDVIVYEGGGGAEHTSISVFLQGC